MGKSLTTVAAIGLAGCGMLDQMRHPDVIRLNLGRLADPVAVCERLVGDAHVPRVTVEEPGSLAGGPARSLSQVGVNFTINGVRARFECLLEDEKIGFIRIEPPPAQLVGVRGSEEKRPGSGTYDVDEDRTGPNGVPDGQVDRTTREFSLDGDEGSPSVPGVIAKMMAQRHLDVLATAANAIFEQHQRWAHLGPEGRCWR